MLQIDLIITELDVGGAERALTRLAIGLQERGDDVRVFSLGSLPGTGLDGLVIDLRQRGIEVSSGEGNGAAHVGSVFRKLRRWLSQRPLAVRQSFLFHANVLTLHAMSSSCRRRWIGGIRVADPNRLRLVIEGYALRRAAHVVCVSAAVESFAQHRYRISPDRLSVIGNAVEMDRFVDATPLNWQSVGWSAAANVALFIGRLHPQKNIELLQRTLDSFAPVGTDRKLVVVGRGPREAELRQWADADAGDRVRVLDWSADVASLIAGSRLLVLPSHYEGMPNVVLEAMAGGRPVVCSRVEGSRELIGDDPDQGFEPGDDGDFIAKVNRFLSDSKFADHVGASNQTRAAKDFSAPQIIDAYRNVYAKLA